MYRQSAARLATGRLSSYHALALTARESLFSLSGFTTLTAPYLLALFSGVPVRHPLFICLAEPSGSRPRCPTTTKLREGWETVKPDREIFSTFLFWLVRGLKMSWRLRAALRRSRARWTNEPDKYPCQRIGRLSFDLSACDGVPGLSLPTSPHGPVGEPIVSLTGYPCSFVHRISVCLHDLRAR
jgi:hypothetical protein